MKKKAIFGILAVAIVGLLALGLVSAYRGVGFGEQENREEIQAAVEAGNFEAWKEAHGKMLTEENFEKVQERFQNMEQMRTNFGEAKQALEDGDYEAWQAAVADCEKARFNAEDVSAEDFEIMVQMHQARQDGDFELAHELAEDLSFDMPFGEGMGKGMGRDGSGRFGGHNMKMGE
ncbi:MAG: hypothetical protein ABIE94_05730 [archaeon]